MHLNWKNFENLIFFNTNIKPYEIKVPKVTIQPMSLIWSPINILKHSFPETTRTIELKFHMDFVLS